MIDVVFLPRTGFISCNLLNVALSHDICHLEKMYLLIKTFSGNRERKKTNFRFSGNWKKKGKRKQGVPQSQTVALPRHQEEEETDKTKQAQIE